MIIASRFSNRDVEIEGVKRTFSTEMHQRRISNTELGFDDAYTAL